MRGRTVLTSVVPWVALAVLLGWHGWQWRETVRQRRAYLDTLSADQRAMVTDLKIYDHPPLWKVYSFKDYMPAEGECKRVWVLEAQAGQVLLYQRLDDPDYLQVAILSGRGSPIAAVGTVKGGKFPSYVSVTPQTGPMKGKLLGDYDLDGEFEVKWPRDSTPAATAPSE